MADYITFNLEFNTRRLALPPRVSPLNPMDYNLPHMLIEQHRHNERRRIETEIVDQAKANVNIMLEHIRSLDFGATAYPSPFPDEWPCPDPNQWDVKFFREKILREPGFPALLISPTMSLKETTWQDHLETMIDSVVVSFDGTALDSRRHRLELGFRVMRAKHNINRDIKKLCKLFCLYEAAPQYYVPL
ncbi:hypothetical protein OBBRIDRAFT_832761 [Obba rivulosa]|uniref:Uncharacterized protein n=1 Tax=Obba rivulosa TaxID=1052685 RepID=A0A8E2J2D5_9APHY|nr:hypothetical protein OBBRIDRAFT_832761 [Obba rivulosa]